MITNINVAFFMLIATLSIILSSNYSLAFDSEAQESLKCIHHFSDYESKYLIPGDTLHSIALKESGRVHSVHKIKMPWPWAVNAEGQGYYFNNKMEAVNFVKDQIIKGKENIDIGCMQVNLKYHAGAFRTLEDAFDPKVNIGYAAQFLKSKYDNLRSWHKAIAHYHSATFELGYKYKQDVINIANNMPLYQAALNKYIYNNMIHPELTALNPLRVEFIPQAPIKSFNNSKTKSLNRLRSNLMVPVYSKYKS